MRDKTATTILGLVVLLIAGGVVFLVGRAILTTARPKIATAGIAFVTALAIPAVTGYYQRRQQIEADQRAQKAVVYQELLDAYFDQMMRVVLDGRKQSRPPQAVSPELLQKYHNVTKKLILWGGDDVVKEYKDYRQTLLGQRDGVPKELPFALTGLEAVLFAIRKDLGYANKGLTERDLLAMFVNDTNEPSPQSTDSVPVGTGVASANTPPSPKPTDAQRRRRR